MEWLGATIEINCFLSFLGQVTIDFNGLGWFFTIGLTMEWLLTIVKFSYILKAGFAGFQNPQTIWNFPQKDRLRTRKISILQYVRNKGEEASSKTKVCRKVLHNM